MTSPARASWQPAGDCRADAPSLPRRIPLAALLLAFSLPGCTSLEPSESSSLLGTGISPSPVLARPDPVVEQIAEAADRASASLVKLAQVERQRDPVPNIQPITNAPPELMRLVSVEWVGPIEQLVPRLAERASYGFRQLGETPPTPVIVELDAYERPIIEVLRDIGLKATSRAEIVVVGPQRMIELRYAANPRTR